MAITKITRDALNTGIDDNSDATAITIDSSERVGIGGAPDDAKLKVKTSAVNSLVDNVADEFVIENNGASGMTILSANNNSGFILFGDNDYNAAAGIRYEHANSAMSFRVNSAWDRLRIDSAGRVTAPNQPSCFIRLFPSVGNATTVTGGSVSHNIGSHYNAANGRFTAPIAGRYFVSFGFLTNSANNRVEMQVRKNNSPVIAGNEATGSNPHGSVSGACVVTMAVNDYFDFYNVSGTLYGGHDNNYLSIHLVG